VGAYRWDVLAAGYVNLATGDVVFPEVGPAAVLAGANYPGTSNYPVPSSNVIFVSPTGNNANAGTQVAPKQTIQAAISAVTSGGTIVLREGTYKESIAAPANKVLKMQAYPYEEVWLDGSAVYSSWTANGNGTWTTPYSITHVRFDVTTTNGGNGYKGDDPYRNHPDQVWVDGVPLQQIADNTTPGTGQFSVNQTADTLTIGANPSGKTVRVSEHATALVFSDVAELRGFGIRRYSPNAIEGMNSMVYFGGTSAGSIVENMYFCESAMDSLNISKMNFRVSYCTFQDNGHSGIMTTRSDGLVIENCIFRRLNKGQWQAEPTTAAVKVTVADNITIRYCHVSECPKAYGLWYDVSCMRSYLYGNTVEGGGTMMNCIELELSDGGVINGTQHYSIVASNRLTNAAGKNAAASLLLFDTGYVKVYNNLLTGSGIPLYLWQDERINNNSTIQNVRSFEECPWRTRGNQVANNIMSSGVGANIQFAAYAQVGNFGLLGANMFDKFVGNWLAPNPPGSMAQLGKSDGSRNSYNTISALAAAGSEVGAITGKVGANHQGTTAPANTIAEPLPADVAALLGVPAGLQVVGPVTPTLTLKD